MYFLYIDVIWKFKITVPKLSLSITLKKLNFWIYLSLIKSKNIVNINIWSIYMSFIYVFNIYVLMYDAYGLNCLWGN